MSDDPSPAPDESAALEPEPSSSPDDDASHSWWAEVPILLGAGLGAVGPEVLVAWFGYWLVAVSAVRSLGMGRAWTPCLGWLVIVGLRQLTLDEVQWGIVAGWLCYGATVDWWGYHAPRLRVVLVLMLGIAWWHME